MSDTESDQRARLLSEIRRIVGDAQADGGIVFTAYHAASLFAAYPGAHFSVGRIVDEIALAATASGVAVEIARADGADHSPT